MHVNCYYLGPRKITIICKDWAFNRHVIWHRTTRFVYRPTCKQHLTRSTLAMVSALHIVYTMYAYTRNAHGLTSVDWSQTEWLSNGKKWPLKVFKILPVGSSLVSKRIVIFYIIIQHFDGSEIWKNLKLIGILCLNILKMFVDGSTVTIGAWSGRINELSCLQLYHLKSSSSSICHIIVK